ncbi:MAG TPA: polysaccharide deacetylase family protein [Rubrobacteraceae bacterium]|nr:polysaccharide deacetylase family protein [Rubrobacteraceae bacterium]
MSDLPEETTSVWGPDSCRAGVSVTFDNLGEAADLERGQWPENEPLGRHFSVKRTLPRILDTLEELALRATFFVEGINAELNSEALLEISNSGHELGYHGWRHEFWPDLNPSNEARLLERGARKMGELGVRPRGFRPPGGRLTPSSPELLESLGFTHCSPAGTGIGFLGNLVVLPFEWRLIDAYFFLPRFGGLRETDTGSSEPLPLVRFRETLSSALQGVVRDGGHLTLVFHPFLEEQEDRFEIMRGALEAVRDLTQDGLVWCAPCRDVASWVRERPGAFGNGLRLDPTEA